MRKRITQPQLKEILSYDQETGIFVWIKPTSKRFKVGDRAGSKCKTHGYRHIGIMGISYGEHRLAWLYVYGEFPEQTDHINHIRDDNRIKNLRDVSPADNAKNLSIYSNSESGIAGVVWQKKSYRWKSMIAVNGKDLYLGVYVDKFEAICVRMSANNKYGYHENHGSRSNSNGGK
jgi:hypothetical protein